MENKIIGGDSVILFDFKPDSIKSKIDTGAETSSIHCPEAFIKNGNLHCKLLDHPEMITFKDYKIKNVKSSNGLKNKRYCVKLKFNLGDESFESDFTLNNRDKMKYPVLLGKKFLDDNKFLVDVSKPYSETVKEGYHIRTFTNGVDNDELVWHRDREDRIVKSVGHTDWMVQLDGELPKPLTESIYIPKNTYHRVIKGNGDLTVKIKKILKESEMGWMESIPSDYNLELYNFLNQNFKVTERTYEFDSNPLVIKSLVGMDEIFNMNYDSKKRILNKIYWLIEDENDLSDLDKGVIRKTIRVFLNEKYKQ